MFSNSLACCGNNNEDRLKMVTGSQTYQATQTAKLPFKGSPEALITPRIVFKKAKLMSTFGHSVTCPKLCHHTTVDINIRSNSVQT
jgi:hypothetical protein